jgi:hypothetical protein
VSAQKIVVVLSVQWGYPGDKVSRWFYINPANHSGRRLWRLIGHSNFIVTNACSEMVYRASDQGTPDPKWLRRNLKALCPDIVLVCGAVANTTFKDDMVRKDTRVFRLPHPAARNWTKKLIQSWATRIQRELA